MVDDSLEDARFCEYALGSSGLRIEFAHHELSVVRRSRAVGRDWIVGTMESERQSVEGRRWNW